MDINIANSQAQLIADDNFDAVVDAQYDEMTDEFSAEFEMMEYAARSYDNDSKFYGETL